MENETAIKTPSVNKRSQPSAMPREEDLKSARKLIEIAKKERQEQFAAEFNALKEKYPDITVDFIIQNEQELMMKIFNEIKSAPKGMSILAQ